MIRTANLNDIDALIALEEKCFKSDRLSRRSFHHMTTRAHATLIVDDRQEYLGGYVLVLYNRATALARLYSIAVAPECRGQGVGRALAEAAEADALNQGCVALRLEIRRDNAPSQGLFKALGYRQFDIVDDYYEDHMGALRFEKTLVIQPNISIARVPFYQQTLYFTCGPACLMMAMQALNPKSKLDRRLELRIWRESTTVFMTAGHGGCGPYGMALSAHKRGFDVEVFVRNPGVFLINSVRSPLKKEVMRLVQEDFLDEMEQAGLHLEHRAIGVAELQSKFENGGIPVVLISSSRIYEERSPHWVTVTGFDAQFVYVHDPFVDIEEGEILSDSINIPIARSEFERMARYGKNGQRAVLILSNSES